MNAAQETLLAIQERDRKILDLQRSLDRLPSDREMAKAHLQEDEAACAAAQAKANENEIATKNLELDIETRRESIAKLKTQQFQTKKNAEFQAMTHEIERYGREVAELEDQELELMEVLEGLKATLGAAREALAKTQVQVDEELGQLEERERNSGSQIAELREEIAALKAKIDPDLADQYQRIFDSKADFGIVPVDHGVCGGCHMKIPPDNIKQGRNAGAAPVFCINCGRMIYVLE